MSQLLNSGFLYSGCELMHIHMTFACIKYLKYYQDMSDMNTYQIIILFELLKLYFNCFYFFKIIPNLFFKLFYYLLLSGSSSYPHH